MDKETSIPGLDGISQDYDEYYAMTEDQVREDGHSATMGHSHDNGSCPGHDHDELSPYGSPFPPVDINILTDEQLLMFFTYPDEMKQDMLAHLQNPSASTHSCLPSRASLREQLEEARHLMDVVQHFENYGTVSLQSVEQEERNFQRLPHRYQGVLSRITTLADRFRAVRESIVENQLFLSQMLSVQDAFYSDNINYPRVRGLLGSLDPSKMSKVRSALRQLQRDWSEEGAAEREESYGVLIKDILRLHPIRSADAGKDGEGVHNAAHSENYDDLEVGKDRMENANSCRVSPKKQDRNLTSAPRVLVPGAGLGRLPWELANLGYNSEGNELSYYMLLPAFFILNCCDANKTKEYGIACNVMENTNWLSGEDRARQVKIPDTSPVFASPNTMFSMASGDFLDLYGSAGGEDNGQDKFDCIATCFFIDTAANIFDYLHTISTRLHTNGTWVNIGPLYYHFANDPNHASIELTWDEIKQILPTFGLALETESVGNKCGYTVQYGNMMRYEYDCVHSVCRKIGPSQL